MDYNVAPDPAKLLAQADKAYSSVGSGFSSWFGSRTDKLEDAAELYIKAGAAYRRQGMGLEAGRAYEKVALILFFLSSRPNCTLF